MSVVESHPFLSKEKPARVLGVALRVEVYLEHDYESREAELARQYADEVLEAMAEWLVSTPVGWRETCRNNGDLYSAIERVPLHPALCYASVYAEKGGVTLPFSVWPGKETT